NFARSCPPAGGTRILCRGRPGGGDSGGGVMSDLPGSSALDGTPDERAEATSLEAGSIEQVQRDQRRRWRAGQRVPVEAYLAQCPALAGRDEDVLDLIVGELLLRQERGEPVRADEYLWRFPRYAPQLC